MSIEIVPHAKAHVGAVAAFNRRLAAGGSPWSFYTAASSDLAVRLTRASRKKFVRSLSARRRTPVS